MSEACVPNTHVNGRYAVLAEPRSKAPPRFVSRRRRSLPRTEPVAWPLTSCVAAPPKRGPTLRSSPPRRNRQARLHRRLVKDDDFVEPGRLPSTSAHSSAPARALQTACAARPTLTGRGLRLCPSAAGLHRPQPACAGPNRLAPARQLALATRLTPGWKVRDHCEPATALAALPPRTGFRRPFTIRARGRVARPERVSARTRRLSSTSATRSIHEHNHGPPDPRFVPCRRDGPSLRWVEAPAPDGVEAPSATPTAESG